jgi:lantibiotic modifying enzyme
LDFSLANGMISYGMYFLSRITNCDNMVFAQKEIMVYLVNYLDCFLPEDISEANEPENLTIQQGYLAVIPFLCQTYKANINNFTVSRILEKYVKFILQTEKQQNTVLRFPNQVHNGSCFLRWDCGDLAVANVLLQAAKISNNKEWESKALEIALRTTLVEEIESPATSTINGTAGITHLYNRLYQHYHLPELKGAAIYWLDKTLSILETQKNVPTENGLINGLAGIGLVLMAVISETEPTWDSAILMN